MDSFWSGLVGNIIGAALGSALSIWGARHIFRKEQGELRRRDNAERYSSIQKAVDSLNDFAAADTDGTKRAAWKGFCDSMDATRVEQGAGHYSTEVGRALEPFHELMNTRLNLLARYVPGVPPLDPPAPPLAELVAEIEATLLAVQKAAKI